MIQKVSNLLRALKQRWGPSHVKQRLWNKEFADGRWSKLEVTTGERVYEFIEMRCRGGSILDLGCGSGNTGNELNLQAYEAYTGVDVSDVAVEKAKERSERNGRAGKNRYYQSDIVSYVPKQMYDVILFRESIYYIPMHKIRATLGRYSKFLTDDGVFIITAYDRNAYASIVKLLEENFDIFGKCLGTKQEIIVVFR